MNQYHQSESTECGLACLAIALEQLGAPVELSELRRKHLISSRGLTVKELVDIAASLGLVGRAVRCELEELPDLKCPAVLHWGLNHFVVLEKSRMALPLLLILQSANLNSSSHKSQINLLV